LVPSKALGEPNDLGKSNMENTMTRPAVSEARDLLRMAISKAAETLVKLLDAKDPKLQLRAAEAILSRAGITEADRMNRWDAERMVGGAPDPFKKD
jgi:hypothetical protein